MMALWMTMSQFWSSIAKIATVTFYGTRNSSGAELDKEY